MLPEHLEHRKACARGHCVPGYLQHRNARNERTLGGKMEEQSFYGCIAWNKETGCYSIVECENQAEAEAFMGLHRFEDRLICRDKPTYYRLRRAVTGQPEY